MEICKLNMLEYYIVFAEHLTALSNRYAEQAKSCGCIYGAKTDGAYAGFMCVSNSVISDTCIMKTVLWMRF